MEKKTFQMQETHFKTAVIEEIARKLCGKLHFIIWKSSTKFHKVSKPHFKLRKALFKTGFERNCKNKNVLEFRIFKYYPFNNNIGLYNTSLVCNWLTRISLKSRFDLK